MFCLQFAAASVFLLLFNFFIFKLADLCQPGSYGKNRGTNPSHNEASVSPCYLCHPGSYQPNYGATKCIPCPSGQNANKKGAKYLKDCFNLSSNNQQSLYASCLQVNICQNGGTCRSSSLGFVSCDCQQGFYGKILGFPSVIDA